MFFSVKLAHDLPASQAPVPPSPRPSKHQFEVTPSKTIKPLPPAPLTPCLAFARHTTTPPLPRFSCTFNLVTCQCRMYMKQNGKHTCSCLCLVCSCWVCGDLEARASAEHPPGTPLWSVFNCGYRREQDAVWAARRFRETRVSARGASEVGRLRG